MNFDRLKTSPRLLLEAELTPVQGSRFQPTGFPDLGAAVYDDPEGVRMLLVESPQSMANRLEAVCWDEAGRELVAPLAGLPYVHSEVAEGVTTNSILEAHRLNSPYIVNSDGFDHIEEDIGFRKDEPFDRHKLVRALLKYDPNSLIHGVFLEKVGGVVRLPRVLSAFIEARNASVAPSGGVKVDRVQPATESPAYGTAEDGYGNVPFHRDEYTGQITAYFNVDLAQLRGYGLEEAAEDLLLGLSLFKIRALLRHGLRLRTACDLDVREVRATRPEGWDLPSYEDLADAMPALVSACAAHFNSPPRMEVTYDKSKKRKS